MALISFYLHPFSGGILVLEPQPWSSYESALRKQDMSGVAFRKLDRLKLRPDAYADFLTRRVGFQLLERLQVDSSAKGFDRPLYVFQKPEQRVRKQPS